MFEDNIIRLYLKKGYNDNIDSVWYVTFYEEGKRGPEKLKLQNFC